MSLSLAAFLRSIDLDLDFGIVYSQSLKFNLKLQRIYIKIIIKSLIRIIRMIIILKLRLWYMVMVKLY